MRTLIIYVIVFLTLISACSSSVEPTLIPTETPIPTPTIILTPDQNEPEHGYIHYKVLSEIANPEPNRLLPIETESGWILKNRYGPEIEIYDIEKGESLNTIKIKTPGDRKYEMSMSKGAILCLYINSKETGGYFGEQFLFSPDVGNMGNPIDCSMVMSLEESFPCYWHQSAIQLDIWTDDGTINKGIATPKGWCSDPKNMPNIDFLEEGESEDLIKNGYKLPNGDVVEWTEDNCPFFEVIEIIE